MKYIAGGKIIMPDGIVTGRALAYNEKIAGLTDDIPSGAEVIDAEGRFVSPGFIDIDRKSVV